MATNVGKLAVVVSASAGGLYAGLTQAQAAIKQFGATATQVASAAGVALGGLSAVGAVKWAIGLAADMQLMKLEMERLTGSSERASIVLNQLRDLSIVSPLSLESLAQGANRLMMTKIAAEETLPILKAIGDISSGNAEKFGLLVKALTDTKMAMRLTGQERNQFVNANFNPLLQIAERTGEAMPELIKRMEAGKVSFEEVKQAILDASASGGTFFGVMDTIGKSLSGRMDKLSDSVKVIATSLGEAMLPAASSVVSALESMVGAIGNIDGRSALASAQVIAFAGSFLLTVTYAGRVVAAMRNIVAAIRAMSVAQALFQALSGPQGWATLAASLVVAAGAVAAVEFAFSGVSGEAAKAVEQTKALADQGNKAGSATANAVKSAAQASADLSAKLSEVAGKWADATAGAERHRELLERGAQLAEQFAPPEAVFAGTVQELQDLAAAGAITQEVFDAAFGEAANKLAQARLEAAGLNEQIQGLGAAAANTMEGFRAMADARRATELAINRQAEAVNIQQQIQAAQGGGVRTAEGAFDREMRDIMRETRDTLQQLLDTTKTKPTLVVGTAELY
jgi:hypothetical protein